MCGVYPDNVGDPRRRGGRDGRFRPAVERRAGALVPSFTSGSLTLPGRPTLSVQNFRWPFPSSCREGFVQSETIPGCQPNQAVAENKVAQHLHAMGRSPELVAAFRPSLPSSEAAVSQALIELSFASSWPVRLRDEAHAGSDRVDQDFWIGLRWLGLAVVGGGDRQA